MKLWIVHDTEFGNGKILAERLSKEFDENFKVEIGDIKQVSVNQVIQTNPTAIIFGGAIRKFQGAPRTKKWLKQLNQELITQNQTIKYGASFLTHALPTKNVQGWKKRYFNKLKSAQAIETFYPDVLTTRVKTAEGPILEEEMEKSVNYIHSFISWISQ